MLRLPVVSLAMPPPELAALPVIGKVRAGLSVPELSMAPPEADASPSVMVKPVIEAVTPEATEKTPPALPPLIESTLAPGP